MSFSLFESSRTKGRPFFLYLIKYGEGVNEFYAFTDNEKTITFDGVVYEVRQIAHGDIATTGTLDKSTVEVTTPRTNELFDLFRVYPPSYRVQLTIMKGHNGDPDNSAVTLWSGRILSMSVRGEECTFACEPISTTMRRLGLRRNWQYGCPHVLYGPGCVASKTAVRQIGTVVAATGSKITLMSDWHGPVAPEKFVGGFIEIAGGTITPRTILRVDGQELLVAGLVKDLPPGSAVSIYPGCAHDMADCKDVHNNIQNFGGQPWIPTANPIGAHNNFY